MRPPPDGYCSVMSLNEPEPAQFPYGTYWLRRFVNVRVKPPPERD